MQFTYHLVFELVMLSLLKHTHTHSKTTFMNYFSVLAISLVVSHSSMKYNLPKYLWNHYNITNDVTQIRTWAHRWTVELGVVQLSRPLLFQCTILFLLPWQLKFGITSTQESRKPIIPSTAGMNTIMHSKAHIFDFLFLSHPSCY